MLSCAVAKSMTTWVLTECSDQGATLRTHLVATTETLVGRVPPATVVIASPAVSKQHASLVSTPQGLLVRDLGSTNGTFVNGAIVREHYCNEGDFVQFATTVFRVNRQADANIGATLEGGAFLYAAALLEFEQLMNGRGLLPVFQPIVDLKGQANVAYELLARSTHEQLKTPLAMFNTATLLGQECQLSELVRREGTRIASASHQCANLFVNTHPKEVINERFLASLAELRSQNRDMMITVEIHEAAVTNRDEMRAFRDVLRQHSMFLAYDDFGAGQTRLDELAEVSPDYLKFDIKLIRGLDQAPLSRQAMVKSLVQMTRDLGICPLAEGVETLGEASICHELGFELAQGFLWGRPQAWPERQ